MRTTLVAIGDPFLGPINRVRTRSVSSVGEVDAVDVQFHSEVHRPPGVRLCVSNGARSIQHVCPEAAVVGVHGIVNTIRVIVRTRLGRRTP